MSSCPSDGAIEARWKKGPSSIVSLPASDVFLVIKRGRYRWSLLKERIGLEMLSAMDKEEVSDFSLGPRVPHHGE